MDNPQALLPCPFCGSEALDKGEYATGYHEFEWRIVCTDCHVFVVGGSEATVIGAWHRRPDQKGGV